MWTVALAALALATGAAPAQGSRTGEIASGDGVSGLTAYGGHLVFSRRENDRYRLYDWYAGRLRALPVPPRATTFDADAGPDEHGRPVVVYSACHARCRVMQLRLDRPTRPRALKTEGRRPSMWRGRLAYVAGGKLWLRDKQTLRRLPLPTHAAVETLDLGPRAAAFTWATKDVGVGIGPGWVLQVDPLRGGSEEMVRGYISGACGFVRPLTPTAAGVGAFWVQSGATCDVTQAIFAEADVHYAHPRSATVAGQLIVGATRDATATYYLSAAPRSIDGPPNRTSCEHTACSLIRVKTLPWRPRTPGHRFGPHPG
ncbi:MAG TPA: hypothetical protein VNS09_19600 [Solirubrobacter sp.]|nr:hypothetical protein [Solirubrobacter sp.]